MLIKTHKSMTARVLDQLGKSQESIDHIYYVTAKHQHDSVYKPVIDFKQVLMIKDEIIVNEMKYNKFETTIYNLKDVNINPLKIEYKHSYDPNSQYISLEGVVNVNFLAQNNIITSLTHQYKPKNKNLSTGTKNWDNYINFIKAIYEYQTKNSHCNNNGKEE